MPLRLRSAGGGGVTLKSPIALAVEAALEVPAYDGAKLLTTKTPGTVLQLVSATTSSTLATSSASDVSTGFSVTITPNSASNKIFIQMAGGGMDYGGSTSGNALQVSVYRNGVKLADIAGGTYSGTYGLVMAGAFMDTGHNSTSAVTYTLYIRSTGGVTGYLINGGSSVSRPLVLTAMEIAG
jgi:hypothetical protein